MYMCKPKGREGTYVRTLWMWHALGKNNVISQSQILVAEKEL